MNTLYCETSTSVHLSPVLNYPLSLFDNFVTMLLCFICCIFHKQQSGKLDFNDVTDDLTKCEHVYTEALFVCFLNLIVITSNIK